MSRTTSYRKQLLQAVDVFLEKTPSAYARAQDIIQQGYIALHNEENALTINWIIWGILFAKLTDSVFYESEEFLQETRDMLLGQSSRNIASQIFSEDCRSCFTTDEAEWYAQLMGMVDFVTTIPFEKIYKATSQAWRNQETWETMRTYIPEVIQAEKLEEEYQQRKSVIEHIYALNPSPDDIDNEKIYHLVLQEVSSLLLEIGVSKGAVYSGYPILRGFHLETEGSTSFPPKAVNTTQGLLWSKRTLDAISGKDNFLFISWRLSKAPTFDADMLLISLH